jgi:hypothetical protein
MLQRYVKSDKPQKESRLSVQKSLFKAKKPVQKSLFTGTKVAFYPAFYGGLRPFLPYARARQALTSFA